MSRISFLFLGVVCAICINTDTIAQKRHSPKADTFYLKGTLDSLANSTVYLFFKDQQKTITLKSKVSPQGILFSKANITEPTKVFFNQKGPNIDIMSQELYSPISFWAEPGKTTIAAENPATKAIKFYGNKSQAEANVLVDQMRVVEDGQNKIIALGNDAQQKGTFNDLKPKLDKSWDSTETSRRNIIIRFMKAYPNSFVSLNLVNEYMHVFKAYNESDRLIGAYDGLSPGIRSSNNALRVKTKLGIEGELKIGARVKEISQKDSSGNLVSLSSYRGNYVLVDFWASWCVPCRNEIPGLKQVLTKYKDKKFTIISISIDGNKKEWINALREEKMPWKNISDLKGSNGFAAKEFNIRFIPQNLLLNKDGVIIAKNLSLDELEAKLASIK